MSESALKYFEDSFVVMEYMNSLNIEPSEIYNNTYNQPELVAMGEFLSYVHNTWGVTLPLIPILASWSEFTYQTLECSTCTFTILIKYDFRMFLETSIEAAHKRVYK
jgi:hypothetical protein